MPILVIILVVVVGGLFAYASWKQAEERRKDLALLAQQLGWVFAPRRDTSHDEEYAHFEIFRQGHSRSAFNTLFGELEIAKRPCAAKAGDFEYRVTTSDGKTTTTHTYQFSYLIVELPFPAVADVLIRPEGIFDKLAGAFGFDDIDFESEEFSRRFHVKSPDKRFAYAVIHPRMMELLLDVRPPAIDIECGRCCLSDGSRCWSAAQFRDQIGFLSRFFALWPEHVVADLETR